MLLSLFFSSLWIIDDCTLVLPLMPWCFVVVERIYNTFNVKDLKFIQTMTRRKKTKNMFTQESEKKKHFYDQCFAIPAVYWAVWFVDISLIKKKHILNMKPKLHSLAQLLIRPWIWSQQDAVYRYVMFCQSLSPFTSMI